MAVREGGGGSAPSALRQAHNIIVPPRASVLTRQDAPPQPIAVLLPVPLNPLICRGTGTTARRGPRAGPPVPITRSPAYVAEKGGGRRRDATWFRRHRPLHLGPQRVKVRSKRLHRGSELREDGCNVGHDLRTQGTQVQGHQRVHGHGPPRRGQGGIRRQRGTCGAGCQGQAGHCPRMADTAEPATTRRRTANCGVAEFQPV